MSQNPNLSQPFAYQNAYSPNPSQPPMLSPNPMGGPPYPQQDPPVNPGISPARMPQTNYGAPEPGLKPAFKGSNLGSPFLIDQQNRPYPSSPYGNAPSSEQNMNGTQVSGLRARPGQNVPAWGQQQRIPVSPVQPMQKLSTGGVGPPNQVLSGPPQSLAVDGSDIPNLSQVPSSSGLPLPPQGSQIVNSSPQVTPGTSRPTNSTQNIPGLATAPNAGLYPQRNVSDNRQFTSPQPSDGLYPPGGPQFPPNNSLATPQPVTGPSPAGAQPMRHRYSQQLPRLWMAFSKFEDTNWPAVANFMEAESVEECKDYWKASKKGSRRADKIKNQVWPRNKPSSTDKDFDVDRDKTDKPLGRIREGGGGGGGERRAETGGNSNHLERDRDDYRSLAGLGNLGNHSAPQYNTYGLSPQFLDALGISGPLTSRVFVANLDYKVSTQKLEEVFKLAGKVVKIDLKRDEDGNSKGHGTIEMGHPVEAVQAISMFNEQKFFNRTMSVRIDKKHQDDPEKKRLPEGLQSVGKGLGANGLPLHLSSVFQLSTELKNSEEEYRSSKMAFKYVNYLPFKNEAKTDDSREDTLFSKKTTKKLESPILYGDTRDCLINRWNRLVGKNNKAVALSCRPRDNIEDCIFGIIININQRGLSLYRLQVTLEKCFAKPSVTVNVKDINALPDCRLEILFYIGLPLSSRRLSLREALEVVKNSNLPCRKMQLPAPKITSADEGIDMISYKNDLQKKLKKLKKDVALLKSMPSRIPDNVYITLDSSEEDVDLDDLTNWRIKGLF